MFSCSKPFALRLDKGFESVGQENAFIQGSGSQSNREGGRGVFASMPIRNTGSEISTKSNGFD